MSLDLSETLVVGITSTALFDLTESDDLFNAASATDRVVAVKEYREHTRQHENERLPDGTGMPLVKALLALNKHQEGGKPLVEVVVMSRNSPETGIRVFNNIRMRDLSITRSAFTGGESVVPYLEAFNVDLFLITNTNDAQKASDSGHCATAIVKAPPSTPDEILEMER